MSFLEDHMAGKHQAEIVEIMTAIDPCLYGHSRMISLFALLRMVAVMLGPAEKETRQGVIHEIPLMLSGILKRMDKMMEEQKHGKNTNRGRSPR